MNPVLARLAGIRVVPVAVIADPAHAAPLAAALHAGGLPTVEITLRTPAALAAIAAAARDPAVLVGAGTVLTPAQVDAAADAGARYLVSPGLSAAVVARARERGLPVIPGVCTPSEVMAALELGLEAVKFFPAGAYGGPATLKALGAVFPQIGFVPTGGIDPAGLSAYLALPGVLACGGTWITPPAALAAGRWDEITRLATEAAAIAAPFRDR